MRPVHRASVHRHNSRRYHTKKHNKLHHLSTGSTSLARRPNIAQNTRHLSKQYAYQPKPATTLSRRHLSSPPIPSEPGTENYLQTQTPAVSEHDTMNNEDLFTKLNLDESGYPLDQENEINPSLSQRLKDVMKQVHLGFKPYSTIVAGAPDDYRERNKNAMILDDRPDEHQRRLQTREDLLFKMHSQKAQDEEIERAVRIQMRGMDASEHDIETLRSKRTILRPIRERIPLQTRELLRLLLEEASVRNLNEQGQRDLSQSFLPNGKPKPLPLGYDPNKLISLPQSHAHTSSNTDSSVELANHHIILSEISDSRLIKEITKIVVQWFRSGTRTQPLPENDQLLSNKAKLETGVSAIFSSNRAQEGGRSFSYAEFLEELHNAPEQEANRKPEQGEDASTTDDSLVGIALARYNVHRQAMYEKDAAAAAATHVQDEPQATTHHNHQHDTTQPDQSPINQHKLQTDQQSSDDVQSAPASTIYHTPDIFLPSHLTNQINTSQQDTTTPTPSEQLPSSSQPNTLLKSESAFNQLVAIKPIVDIMERLPDNSQELSHQLRQKDFLSNSVMRRKPRGKLTDIQLRDLLVHATRGMPHKTLQDRFNIDILSLFEDPDQSQAIANAVDSIGGFTPVNFRVKADFDDNFIAAIKALHKQRLELEKEAVPTVDNKSDHKRHQELENEHLAFLYRLATPDAEGYTVLKKTDILVPDFPDGVLELLLNEAVDSQLAADGGSDAYTLNESHEDSMRTALIREMLVLKGRTVEDLHRLGVFNRAPYDDLQHPTDSMDEAGGQRNRYSFNDEMRLMHRLTDEKQVEQHLEGIYSKEGIKRSEEYSTRMAKHLTGSDTIVKEHQQALADKNQKESAGLYVFDSATPDWKSRQKVHGRGEITLQPINRFAQLAVAASVISKYGHLDQQYRKNAGINMSTVDELIISALEEGDIPISSWTPQETKQYITALKTEALSFPHLAVETMSDCIHVPYIMTGKLDNIPSLYLGVWDRALASNPTSLRRYGLKAQDSTPLGPYHPMFLLTVTAGNFMQNSQWSLDAIKYLLGGDVDDRLEAERFKIRLENQSIDDNATSSTTTSKTTAPTSTSHFDIGVGSSKHASVVDNLNSIPDLLTEEDARTASAQYHQTANEEHQKEQEQLQIQEQQKALANRIEIAAKAAGLISDRVKLGNNDPNEIIYNTTSMSEYFHNLYVNQDDIISPIEELLHNGLISRNVFQQFVASHDQPEKLQQLRHFVLNEYHKFRHEQLAEVKNDILGNQVMGQVNDAVFENNNNNQQQQQSPPPPKQPDFDIDSYDPDSYHQKRREAMMRATSGNNNGDQHHDLFGGPLNVHSYLENIATTERGQRIQREFERSTADMYGTATVDEANRLKEAQKQRKQNKTSAAVHMRSTFKE